MTGRSFRGVARVVGGVSRSVVAGDWRDLPVMSSKGATGHLLHTGAAPALALALDALEHRRIEPGPPVDLPVPTRRLRIVDRPVPASPTYAVVNGFGFGGNNASVVLGAPMTEAGSRT